ncbi:MAG TPA: TonB-dependent receptor, partial [Candidatus Limnocylindrales bacterium]|nr:TonB-dependent receptor [Candidatus Limnocylindrales bacterium]
GAAIDAPGPPDAPPASDPADASSDQDRGELAWRLRHARRGILKDITIPDDVVADDSLVPATSPFGASAGRGQTGSSASLSSSLFAGVPLTGQFNLLTTGSLDSPARLFTPDSFSRSIAYVSLAAPVGEHGDWAVRGALTGGDISAWFAAGAYTTRAPARHRYDLGASYSTQRYDGGNPAALRQVSEGSRNVGALYGFDTFALTPAVSLAYGARVSRYDYLDQGLLLDPRISLTLAPSDGVRVNAVASRNALAPGAEEFLPPVEGGLWLPPQRTFSSIIEGRSLEPEHTSHLAVQVERDIKASTVALRVFHQRVDDQLITVFGRDTPSARGAGLGHYLVGNVGDVDATGLSASFGGALASRVHGSVEYTLTRARWTRGDDAADLILLAPSAVRPDSDRIHDLSTSIATEVPETSTRVLVFCRMTSARPAAGSERSAYDPRFDVQVHQSLPFMNFTSARWEMLVAVRNFFRDGSFDSSVFDELLVTQPPKRIVGGLTVRF